MMHHQTAFDDSESSCLPRLESSKASVMERDARTGASIDHEKPDHKLDGGHPRQGHRRGYRLMQVTAS